MKPKNIAVICEYKLFPERIGGMDYFFVTYDKAAKEKGYAVTWFFKEVVPFEFYKNLNIVSAQNKGIEVCFLKHCIANNLTYDIVVTHFLQPVSLFFKQIKSLFSCYIINVDHNPRPLTGFPLKKRIKNRVKGFLYGKYVDKLIGVSRYTEKHILRDFGGFLKPKTTFIYNGVKTELFQKQQVSRKNLPLKCIVVSHLRESKGIHDLIAAVDLLKSEEQNQLKIDIFGEGPYEMHLRNLQKENNLDHIINFMGSKPNINQWMPKYQYLIQPTYMECFSLSLLESLATNVPVITTTVGGNLELVINGVNGFIVEPKNPEQLALVLSGLIKGELSIEGDVSNLIASDFNLNFMVTNHINLLKCI